MPFSLYSREAAFQGEGKHRIPLQIVKGNGAARLIPKGTRERRSASSDKEKAGQPMVM